MLRKVKVYLMDAMSSNSMKSSNPYSGIHEAEVTKCLDTMCLDPGCNQGGCMVCISNEDNAVVYDGSSVTSPKNWNNPKFGDPCYALHTDSRNYVVISLEGNGARPSHLGKGFSEDNTMYTLNTIEQHSVCYSIDCRNMYLNEEKSGTLQAKNSGGCSLNFLNPILRRNDDGLCDREPSGRQPSDD